MIGQLLLGVCIFGLTQVVIGLAALLRAIPTILKMLRVAVRYLFLGSFRLYRYVLTLVAPRIRQHLGIDISKGLARIVATVGLSIGIGCICLLVLNWSITPWTVGLFSVHGLLVGTIWSDLKSSNGFQYGVNSEWD